MAAILDIWVEGANLRSGSASVIHSTPPGVRQAGLAPVSVSADAGVFHAVRGSTGTVERGFIWFVDQRVEFEMQENEKPCCLGEGEQGFPWENWLSGPMWT